MAQITRAIQKIFGDTGGTGEFGVIGSAAAGAVQTSKDITTIQSLVQYLQGYFQIISDTGVAEIPYSEDLNSLFFLVTTQLAYLFQNGVPEWLNSADQRYYANVSFVQVNGDIYQAILGDDVSNINSQQDPTTETNFWRLIWPSSLSAFLTTVSASTTINLLTNPAPRIINVTGTNSIALTLNNQMARAGEILTIFNNNPNAVTLTGTSGLTSTIPQAGSFIAVSTGSEMIEIARFTEFARGVLRSTTDAEFLTNLGFTAFAQTLRSQANAAAVFNTLGITGLAQSILGDVTNTEVFTTLSIASQAQSAITNTSNPISTVYTGSNASNLDYPIGTTFRATYLFTDGSPEPILNETVIPRIRNDITPRTIDVTNLTANRTPLNGTWRSRGLDSTGDNISVQRTA